MFRWWAKIVKFKAEYTRNSVNGSLRSSLFYIGALHPQFIMLYSSLNKEIRCCCWTLLHDGQTGKKKTTFSPTFTRPKFCYMFLFITHSVLLHEIMKIKWRILFKINRNSFEDFLQNKYGQEGGGENRKLIRNEWSQLNRITIVKYSKKFSSLSWKMLMTRTYPFSLR